jgi:hypothetical protein
MGTGYTRNDTLNNIADGNIINASDLDGEFDAVESAFNESTGHTHDGTAAEGAPITVLGPVQDFIASATEIKPKTTNTLDIGTVSLQFKDMHLDGTAYLDDIQAVGAVDITGDLDVDNINVNGNTVSSTDTNGDINLSPNGTGTVVINTDLDVDNININGNTISSTDTNGNINLVPNGTGEVNLTDNDKLTFGAGSDLQIYHDTSSVDSKIVDTGSGNLRIMADNLRLQTAAGTANYATADNGGAFSLYHNGSAKLATTATGVDVTGTVTADGLTVDTNTLYVDSTNNRVGIGTTSPDRPLEVVATNTTMKITGSGISSTGIVFETNGVERKQIGIPSGDTALAFYSDAGSTEAMRIESDGDIALGNAGSSNYSWIRPYQATTGNMFIDADKGATGSGGSAMIFQTRGSEKMRIENSGNVGIGTSSPSSFYSLADNLVVGTGSGGNGITIYSGSADSGFIGFNDTASASMQGFIQYNHSGDYMAFAPNGSEKMRIDSSGNVGIGTSPSQLLHLSSSSPRIRIDHTSGAIAYVDAATNGVLEIVADDTNVAANSSMRFKVDGSEAMRIDSSGRLLVGTTTAIGKLTVDAVDQYYASSFQVRANGEIGADWRNASGAQVGYIQVNASSTSYVTSSDSRLKENIADADDAGSKIDAIQVRQFDWIADGSHQDYGMIAQELQTVAPEAVSGNPDGDEMMGVDYSKLVPMLIKEVQSLRARVAELENN